MLIKFLLLLLVFTMPLAFASSSTSQMTIVAPVEEDVEESVEESVKTTTSSSSSSGGGGSKNTGVSPAHPGFGGKIKSSDGLPMWLQQPILWWNSDQITAQEFSSIMGWLIDDDIIKIENKIKPEKQAIPMAHSTKQLFSLWERDILSESIILKLVDTYREYGIW